MFLATTPRQLALSKKQKNPPPPIELHLLQESTVAEERTSPPASPPNRLHQEAADLSSRATPIKRRALNQSPEIAPSSGFSFATHYLKMMRTPVREEPFYLHSPLPA